MYTCDWCGKAVEYDQKIVHISAHRLAVGQRTGNLMLSDDTFEDGGMEKLFHVGCFSGRSLPSLLSLARHGQSTCAWCGEDLCPHERVVEATLHRVFFGERIQAPALASLTFADGLVSRLFHTSCFEPNVEPVLMNARAIFRT